MMSVALSLEGPENKEGIKLFRAKDKVCLELISKKKRKKKKALPNCYLSQKECCGIKNRKRLDKQSCRKKCGDEVKIVQCKFELVIGKCF